MATQYIDRNRMEKQRKEIRRNYEKKHNNKELSKAYLIVSNDYSILQREVLIILG